MSGSPRVAARTIPALVGLLLAAPWLACRSTPGGADGTGAEAGRAAGTRIVLLGSGTPRADPDRSGPAIAVISGGRAYLFDAGAGIVRRAGAAFRAGWKELAPARLDLVFFTHLHSDHTLGYPDLVLSPWVLGRETPLEAYGPPGLQAMTDHLLAAWAEDIRVRIEGAERNEPAGIRVNVHEVLPGPVVRDGNVSITAFAVPHGSWPNSYGYRIEAADRTIVLSGDTGPTDVVARACDGCDVLVHEARAVAGFDALPADWQAYHASFHTSTAELARVAERAHPGLLLLVHPLVWKDREHEEQLVDEVRRGWSGRVVLGEDLRDY